MTVARYGRHAENAARAFNALIRSDAINTLAVDSQRYFTREEAAQYLRISVETVKRAIYGGRLRAKKSGENGGGKYLISREDLDAFFESMQDA